MTARPRIAITMGDPSGIGPEVVAKALNSPEVATLADCIVIGNAAVLHAALAAAGSTRDIAAITEPSDLVPATAVGIIDLDGSEGSTFPIGKLNTESALVAHLWIERAARLCLSREVDAMVTAPINKEALRMAGIMETGHQEVLQRLSGADHVATMLVSGTLRCMHLSTHKPLRDACAFVTRANVLRAIELTNTHFLRWGFATPRIAVAALNPHASDGGLIGREELDEIAPAIAGARAKGINATGPHPADSVFNHALDGRFDVVIVMYHDQGHIAIKVHGFAESVSVNLGLPFIRTSVDHGTAFDIAGKGIADATSMIEAIRLAATLATGSRLD